MKICNNCGMQNNDDDLFCAQCGNSLENAANQPDGQPAYGEAGAGACATPDGAYANQPVNPYPLLQILKEKGGSALFLIATILATINLVVSLLSAFFTNIQETMQKSMSAYQYAMINDAEIWPVLTAIMVVFILVFSIPTILVVIGLWRTYATCKKAGPEPLSTGGLSMIKAGVIIEFVVFILAMVFMALVMLFLIAFAVNGDEFVQKAMESRIDLYGTDLYGTDVQSILMGVCVMMLVITVLAVILGIIYYVKILGSIKTAKQIIQTGTAQKNVSTYVAVLLILGAVFTIFSAIMSLDIITVLAGVTQILFASVIFSFKNAAGAYLRG